MPYIPPIWFGKCALCEKPTFLTRKCPMLCRKCAEEKANEVVWFDLYPKTTKQQQRIETKSPPYQTVKRAKQLRKKAIKLHGFCALCGADENLTAHHPGGRTDLGLTVLCESCHQRYENWNEQLRKLQKGKFVSWGEWQEEYKKMKEKLIK